MTLDWVFGPRMRGPSGGACAARGIGACADPHNII